MKKYIFLSVLLLILLRGIDVIINYDRVKLDGVFAEVQSLFFFNGTKYSDQYTHEKYTKIKLGMTEKEVVAILGEPVSKFKPHDHSKKYMDLIRTSKYMALHHSNDTTLIKHIGYQYSFHPSRGYYYRMRHIIFDENGKVINVIHCYYTRST